VWGTRKWKKTSMKTRNKKKCKAERLPLKGMKRKVDTEKTGKIPADRNHRASTRVDNKEKKSGGLVVSYCL